MANTHTNLLAPDALLIRLDYMGPGLLIVTRGPGGSKLLYGPTTRNEGMGRCDSKGREKARKAQN